MISRDDIRQALARGYTHAPNSRKELDTVLIEAMATEVMDAIEAALVRQYAARKEEFSHDPPQQ